MSLFIAWHYSPDGLPPGSGSVLGVFTERAAAEAKIVDLVDPDEPTPWRLNRRLLDFEPGEAGVAVVAADAPELWFVEPYENKDDRNKRELYVFASRGAALKLVLKIFSDSHGFSDGSPCDECGCQDLCGDECACFLHLASRLIAEGSGTFESPGWVGAGFRMWRVVAT